MRKRFYLPLRLKILIAVLFVVTAIVSVITFTMATMFHEDKSAYVTDLASLAVLSAAQESHSVLAGYQSRLSSAGRVLKDETIAPETKRNLLGDYFTDFPELIGIAIRSDGKELLSAIDEAKTSADGVSKEELAEVLARTPERGVSESDRAVQVANVSIPDRLPCFLMTIELPSTPASKGTTIAALLRLDGLMPIASRSSLFSVSLTDATGILLADADAGRVARRERSGLEAVDAPTDDRRAAVTKMIEVNGSTFIAGFAAAGVGGVRATASLPAATAFLASRDLLKTLMIVSLILLVVAALGAALWARRITGPVERLSTATGEVAKGQFDTQVPVESADEIGRLAESFNAMAGELKSREGALREAQGQLVQSEKMAAFGLLGAGIAHEVKNPLAGILGCAQISLRQAQAGTPVHANLQLIEKETKRCKTIIENLLKFARQEKTAVEVLDVNRPVEDAVAIVHHQLELQHVKVDLSLADGLPVILGNANQLQQVLMNLLINSQQAMGPDGGAITLTTAQKGADAVEILVRDTGSGIPKEIQKRIFDPFFTTKPNGKGTGLGLSVTYGIIKDHGGEISVESELGKGATFSIVLPRFKTPDESGAPQKVAAHA